MPHAGFCLGMARFVFVRYLHGEYSGCYSFSEKAGECGSLRGECDDVRERNGSVGTARLNQLQLLISVPCSLPWHRNS